MPELPLLAQLATAIITLDAEGRIRYLNQSAEQLLATSLRQLRGRYFWRLFAPGQPLLRRLLPSLLRTGSYREADCQITLRPDRELSGDITVSSIDDQEAAFVVEFRVHDLSRHIEIDYQLINQNKISEHLLRNLAHEIKNPLGGIRGAAQLLSSELSRDQQDFTHIIIKEADRLAALVDRMLLTGKPASRIWLNLHEVTEQALDFVSLELPDRIRIRRDYDPSLPEVKAAPEQIYQALLNLLQNGVEAMTPESGDEQVLTLRTRAAHQASIGPRQYRLAIRIDVEDTGPGIPAGIREQIFFPLISSKDSSGLGLGIAQSLIQQHGGLIEFESRPGKTCFSILLPVDQPEAVAPRPVTAHG